MAFTPVSVDPFNIDAFPGAWQHWNLSARGAVRYLFAYNTGSGLLSLYRSTNSGATWPAAIDVGNFPGSLDDNSLLQVQLIVGGGSAGSDLLRTASVINGKSGVQPIEFCAFDLGTRTWTGPTSIGGGFDQNKNDSLAATQCPSIQQFLRRDGSVIVVYQCENFNIPAYSISGDTGIRQVRVLKRSGATWTQLGTFAAGVYTGAFHGADQSFLESDHYVLWTAVIDGADNVHLFLNHAQANQGSEYLQMDLVHVSVSHADVVSATHLIEANVEQMPAVTNPNQPTGSTENGRAAVKSDNSEIAFGYGYQTNTFPAGPGAEVHVARGDMTGSPVAPTWTVDVIATGEPVWNNGFSNDISVTYENPAQIALEWFGGGNVSVGYGEHALANLKVYWATGGTGKLRFSQNTSGSTWTAPAQLWPDPDSGAVSLDGFDVYSSQPSAPPNPPVLPCATENTGTVGVFFSTTLSATGGTPPYTYVLISGPAWLTLTGNVLSGIPTVNGTFSYVAQVTDSLGATALTSSCPLVISAAPPPTPGPLRAGNTLRWQIEAPNRPGRWFAHRYADAIVSHYIVEPSATAPNDQELYLLGSNVWQSQGNTDNFAPINVCILVPSNDQGDERSQKLYPDAMVQAEGIGTLNVTPAFDNALTFAPTLMVPVAGPIIQAQVNIASLGDLRLYRNIGTVFAWTGGPDGPRVLAWEPAAYLQPYLSKRIVTQYINWSYPGWKHVRRFYPGLISTAPVVFTIETQDNRIFTVIIPSTGGQFRVVPLMIPHGCKDLSFAIQLDGQGTVFALFPDAFTLEAKGWADPEYLQLAVWKT